MFPAVRRQSIFHEFPFIACLAVANVALTGFSADLRGHPRSATDSEISLRCHHALDNAWAKFHREPCGEIMFSAIQACDELRGFCLRSPRGKELEKSRLELHQRAARTCTPAEVKNPSMPTAHVRPSRISLTVAETKLRHLAKAEKKKLRSLADMQSSEVTSLSVGELEQASSRVEDGEVHSRKDLQAAQAVINANNLADVSRDAQRGGIHVRSDAVDEVVTAEDVQALTEQSIGREVTMLENSQEPSHDKDHVILQGDMRMPRKRARLAAQHSHVSQRFRAVPEVPNVDVSSSTGAAAPPKVAAGDPWPSALVPFCFAHDVNKLARIAFMEAVQHYRHRGVCVTFRGIPLAADGTTCVQKPSILVQSDTKDGCWSDVGCIAAGNVMNIGRGCEVKGIVAHELGHALGMDHEQARPDRDEYVKVEWSNIKPGFEEEFKVNPEAYIQEPYDYMSLMHYGAYMFSKDKKGRKPTITALDSKVNEALGQAMGLSSIDVLQLTHMYCPAKKILLLPSSGVSDAVAATAPAKSSGWRCTVNRWSIVILVLCPFAP